jgi:rod shape-determining protein MreD
MNKMCWFCRVTLTLIVAMCLRIAPWSHALELYNPDWVLLVLMYWSVVLPERIGIFYAWTYGLLTDVLTGQLFGQHALAYSLVIYACLKLHKRLRQYTLLQQALFVFCGLLLAQLIFFFIKNLQHLAQFNTDFWLPVITGTLCWPLVYRALRCIHIPTDAK